MMSSMQRLMIVLFDKFSVNETVDTDPFIEKHIIQY